MALHWGSSQRYASEHIDIIGYFALRLVNQIKHFFIEVPKKQENKKVPGT